MKQKIIFYIRTLFKENKVHGCNGMNDGVYYPLFEKIFGMSIFDYRDKVHQIQLQNLRTISTDIIENFYEENLSLKYNSPFSMTQKSAIEKLAALDDDCIVIPLDDDDWISPEVAHLEFDHDALNIWRTITLSPFHKNGYRYHDYSEEVFDCDLRNDEILKNFKRLLSNCAAIPGRFVKQLAKANDIKGLSRLLQLHTQPRIYIRETGIIKKEKIYHQYISVYVKHLANVTRMCGWNSLDANAESIKAELSCDSNLIAQFDPSFESYLPSDYQWAECYQRQLIELNRSLPFNFNNRIIPT